MNEGKLWTEEHIGQLTDMVRRKRSVRDMASFLGRTESSVRHKILRMGLGRSSEAKPNPWTPELVMELKKLWRAGYSALHIERQFANGLTRSAILGKLKRLGMSAKDKERVIIQAPSLPPIPKPKPMLKPEPEPEALNLTLLELTDLTCKWPVKGTGIDCRFCGHVPERGSSYCTAHRKRSESPARPEHSERFTYLLRKRNHGTKDQAGITDVADFWKETS